MSFSNLIKELPECEVFRVLDNITSNPTQYLIDPLNFDYIPKWDAQFVVKSLYVINQKLIKPCYMVISMPNRVVDYVILEYQDEFSSVHIPDDYEQMVIPSVACEVSGNHELYHSEENPRVGLDILEKAYQNYPHFQGILDDLAYIYRDEEKFEESLKYFLKLNKLEPNQHHILVEIAELYECLSQKKEAEIFWKKAIKVLEESVLRKGANQYSYLQLADMYKKIDIPDKVKLYESLSNNLNS